MQTGDKRTSHLQSLEKIKRHSLESVYIDHLVSLAEYEGLDKRTFEGIEKYVQELYRKTGPVHIEPRGELEILSRTWWGDTRRSGSGGAGEGV